MSAALPAPVPLRRPHRCDFCKRPESPVSPVVRIRRFGLIAPASVDRSPDRKSGRTTRGVGSLFLCERCWRETAGRRTRAARRAARLLARATPLQAQLPPTLSRTALRDMVRWVNADAIVDEMEGVAS